MRKRTRFKRATDNIRTAMNRVTDSTEGGKYTNAVCNAACTDRVRGLNNAMMWMLGAVEDLNSRIGGISYSENAGDALAQLLNGLNVVLGNCNLSEDCKKELTTLKERLEMTEEELKWATKLHKYSRSPAEIRKKAGITLEDFGKKLSQKSNPAIKEMAMRVAQIQRLEWGNGKDLKLEDAPGFAASILSEFGFDGLIEIKEEPKVTEQQLRWFKDLKDMWLTKAEVTGDIFAGFESVDAHVTPDDRIQVRFEKQDGSASIIAYLDLGLVKVLHDGGS